MTHDEVAAGLLAPIWRGVDPAYKSRYRSTIWQQFEDSIRSAAYTARLGTFYDGLIRRLGATIRADDVASVQAVIQCGDDRAVLRMLRDETTLLVLLVRVANEERKAAYKAEQEAAQGSLF